MASSSSGRSVCFVCGSIFEEDTTSFVHLNVNHVSEFVRLLREHRLREVFPKADPLFFSAVYDENDNSVFTVGDSTSGSGDAGDGTTATGNEQNVQNNNGNPTGSDDGNGSDETDPRRLAGQSVSSSHQLTVGLNGTVESVTSSEDEEENGALQIVENMEGRETRTEAEKRTGSSDGSYTEISAIYSDRHTSSSGAGSNRDDTSGRRESVRESRRRTVSCGRDRPVSRSRSRSPPCNGKQSWRVFSIDRHQATVKDCRGFLLLPYTFKHASLANPDDWKSVQVDCLICRTKLPNYFAAVKHDIQIHGNRSRRLPCAFDKCAFMGRDILELTVHMMVHEEATSEKGLRLCCRFCMKVFSSVNHYADHVSHEYLRFRRIHYEQIALRSLDVRCNICQLVLRGNDWFNHVFGCGGTVATNRTSNEIQKRIQEFRTICGHRLDNCRYFPACSLAQCSFSHPICAHYPACYGYECGRCPLDHKFKDRVCKFCRAD